MVPHEVIIGLKLLADGFRSDALLLVGCDTVLLALTVLSTVKLTDPVRGGGSKKIAGLWYGRL